MSAVKTKVIKVDPAQPDRQGLEEAADTILKGGLVIMPTETVYGLAANADDRRALERLYAIKQRPLDKPFSLHVPDKNIERLAEDIPVRAYKLIQRFWPGPLTIILHAKGERGGGTVGLRMPDHRVALGILALADVPVAMPSANLAGARPPAEFQDAMRDFEGLVELAIDAGRTTLGSESTVVDLTVEPLRVVREGSLGAQEIEEAAGHKTVLFICTGNSCRSVMAKALLEKRLEEAGRKGVEVLSAGIMMAGGMGATEATRELLAREGIDVSAHHSQRVSEEMIQRADIILVMERLHEERVLQMAPQAKNRLFLLKEFAKIHDNDLNIADPIGRSAGFYEETFAVIKEAVERISAIL